MIKGKSITLNKYIRKYIIYKKMMKIEHIILQNVHF